MSKRPMVRIVNDTLLGHKTKIIDVETGLDISNRISGLEITIHANSVDGVTLHTAGTLDVLAEVERIIEPCEHCRAKP